MNEEQALKVAQSYKRQMGDARILADLQELKTRNKRTIAQLVALRERVDELEKKVEACEKDKSPKPGSSGSAKGKKGD